MIHWYSIYRGHKAFYIGQASAVYWTKVRFFFIIEYIVFTYFYLNTQKSILLPLSLSPLKIEIIKWFRGFQDWNDCCLKIACGLLSAENHYTMYWLFTCDPEINMQALLLINGRYFNTLSPLSRQGRFWFPIERWLKANTKPRTKWCDQCWLEMNWPEVVKGRLHCLLYCINPCDCQLCIPHVSNDFYQSVYIYRLSLLYNIL